MYILSESTIVASNTSSINLSQEMCCSFCTLWRIYQKS